MDGRPRVCHLGCAERETPIVKSEKKLISDCLDVAGSPDGGPFFLPWHHEQASHDSYLSIGPLLGAHMSGNPDCAARLLRSLAPQDDD